MFRGFRSKHDFRAVRAPARARWPVLLDPRRDGPAMTTLAVIQHTESEYLGLIEDHFEGRNIRFRYFRPFAHGGTLPMMPGGFDGLILLGGGPYGVVSGSILPSLGPELRLTREFLAEGRPVLGIGLGAVILAAAAGGGAEEAPLRIAVDMVEPEPGTWLAEIGRFPLVSYLRDAPFLPEEARVLARSGDGTVLAFETGPEAAVRAVGFLGHPGAKRGMAEDLAMEFAETPEGLLEGLTALGAAQGEIAEVLGPLVTGLVARLRWM